MQKTTLATFLGLFLAAGTDAHAGNPVPFCSPGDGSVTATCAIGPGQPGHGCVSCANTNGAELLASGSPASDTVSFAQIGMPPTATSIFLQGNSKIASGVAFGDGVRCIGGNLLRLYTATAFAGITAAPNVGEPSIKTRSAALGDVIAPGSTRYYQVYYRDSFCAGGGHFNIGNALEITWP